MTKAKQQILSALAVMAALFGSCLTVSADTVTEGFNDLTYSSGVLVLPDGWNYSGDVSLFAKDTDTYKTKAPSIGVNSNNTTAYLITPELQGDFNFWLRNYTKNYQASVKAYACTYADGVMTLGSLIGEKTLSKTSGTKPDWEKVSFSASVPTRVALLISRCYFDDFTYTEAETVAEATLKVANYDSGSTYDFGTVAAGTTQSFTLSNIGQAALTISSLTVTGGYTITAGGDLTGIAAKGSAEITVATPAADATGALTIVSNDANSPYVINLKSTYKVAVPIMGVTPTEVIFGKVTGNASQDITVSNTGDAELTATIASNNADFSVSTSSLTVAAGAQKTFTITYLYDAAAYGGHAATITVTPNVGEAVTIAASAEVRNPNAWTEDFSGNVLPAGWTIVGDHTSWTFENAEASGSYEKDGWLVTPKLVVTEGESMTFVVKSKQWGSEIIVQYQQDGGTWTQIIKEDCFDKENFKTYTISGLPAGTYRFRIATENIILDNFEGFTLAPSTAVKETWWITYTFHYQDDGGEKTLTDLEQMDIEFDGDDIAFNFPNPVNGNAWMRGSLSVGEGPTAYIFPNGQYIGLFGSDYAYYCGSNGSALTDMVFMYSDDEKAFYDFEHILINNSQTYASYWFYFSDVVITKEKPAPAGITDVKSQVEDDWSDACDLQGRRVNSNYKGLVIKHGKKYLKK